MGDRDKLKKASLFLQTWGAEGALLSWSFVEGGGVAPAHALHEGVAGLGAPSLVSGTGVYVCACLRVRTPACSCQFLDAIENTVWPLSGRPGGGWPWSREHSRAGDA